MSNFLKFIEEDIEAKKVLFSTMPTNTKTDVRKFNDKISSISEKYNEYKISVKKYLDAKSRSFNIKSSDNKLEALRNNVSTLQHVRFILNPLNTHLEKMGFDNLLYQISNYYDLKFDSLNDIINQFLDKFEQAGIRLSINEFDYTCYVNEYMNSFLDARNNKSGNYDKVSEIFESIYWVNPEIIEHIELNFRKLIKKHEKDFNSFITELQKEVMIKNRIIDYEDCLSKLKEAYLQLNMAERENICDIINYAKAGEIDINQYFEDSKVRTSTYSSLMIDSLNLNDKEVMDKFYESLEKLKVNIEEYANFLKFSPLIRNFKNEYEKQIQTEEKLSNKNNINKNLKSIESQIEDKESNLERLNKKILGGGLNFFESRNEKTIKKLKIESVKKAKELYELYKIYDKEYFNDKVLPMLNSSFTITELLNLYYSFDYFKKISIKKVFGLNTYDEIIKYSDEFDLFAMNPTNVIVNGVAVFEENNLEKVIVNKYRLDNIDLNEENLDTDDLEVLLDKIKLLLRVREIEKSKTTVEKIWFMTQVERFNKEENKK